YCCWDFALLYCGLYFLSGNDLGLAPIDGSVTWLPTIESAAAARLFDSTVKPLLMGLSLLVLRSMAGTERTRRRVLRTLILRRLRTWWTSSIRTRVSIPVRKISTTLSALGLLRLPVEH